jgi:26S proteasome regulatory subunit N10
MDNSDWTRNGDYHPSRWDSQADAANLIAENKCEKNPENSIGIVSMAGKRVEVHVTLTNDLSRILNAVKDIKLSQECDFLTALNISVLTLRHRQNKNQKQRIILFVGSPIKHKVEEMVQIGKKLKKYNIATDIISFGHVEENRPLLEGFLNAINNANNSSMLEVPTGYYILDSLFTSPIMNDNMGYDNNMDNEINANNNQFPQNTGSNNNFQSSTGQQASKLNIKNKIK